MARRWPRHSGKHQFSRMPSLTYPYEVPQHHIVLETNHDNGNYGGYYIHQVADSANGVVDVKKAGADEYSAPPQHLNPAVAAAAAVADDEKRTHDDLLAAAASLAALPNAAAVPAGGDEKKTPTTSTARIYTVM